MIDPSFNIVELIETNPITQLSNTYQFKFLTKIKEEFTDYEQKIFVASFYGFLNYDSKTDFVVDLDNIWKWLGFGQKVNAKRVLEKNFILDKDYKLSLCQLAKQTTHTKGGHNRETFMLNIDTFKKFCLKAETKKADEIHDYFIKLERILQEIIKEESNELKIQLEKQIINNEKKENMIREKTILEQFPNNTQCFYYGVIDNVSENNEKLIKFGNSNNLKNRVNKHKDTYSNFTLVNAFKVGNKLQIESAIKENPIFQERLRTITLKNKKYVELLSIEQCSFAELDKIIKNIITSIEYSPENYIKILEENKTLRNKIDEINKNNNTHNFILLTSKYKQLQADYLKLTKMFKRCKKVNECCDDITDVNIDVNQENNDFTNTTSSAIIQNIKQTYFEDTKKYNKLYGSRNDVWCGHAYKTTGGLTIADLTINACGKIVSKKKSIFETLDNKLVKYGVNKKPDTKPEPYHASNSAQNSAQNSASNSASNSSPTFFAIP